MADALLMENAGEAAYFTIPESIGAGDKASQG